MNRIRMAQSGEVSAHGTSRIANTPRSRAHLPAEDGQGKPPACMCIAQCALCIVKRRMIWLAPPMAENRLAYPSFNL
jgi:hypothetical protein